MPPPAYINRITTAVPPHDVHDAFLGFGRLMLDKDARKRALFDRMADRCGIAHRHSFIRPGGTAPSLDADDFYRLEFTLKQSPGIMARHYVNTRPVAFWRDFVYICFNKKLSA